MSTTAAELDIGQCNQLLSQWTLDQRILWAVEQFGESAILLSSMQKTASVLMHTFYRLRLDNDIVFGDTGFHFHETLRTRDLFMRQYRLNIVTVYPELTPEQQENVHGRKLHMCIDGQPECCRMRKEEPFLAYVREHGRRLVMVGARRSDGGRRASLQPVVQDPRTGGFALHPLVDWTDAQVAAYLQEHQVPVHPLYKQSYPSIGCACCTTPVAPGEPARAGRWRHLRDQTGAGPQYCGLNFTDGSGI